MKPGSGTDPLLLALTDAKDRAEEELERVQDRLARTEGEKLHPREHARLLAMWRRSNALSNAWVLMTSKETENGEEHAQEVAILEAMHDEVDEALARYREGVGFES